MSTLDRPAQQPVAILGAVPADVRSALEGHFAFLPRQTLTEMDEVSRSAITLGLTSAISGAKPDAVAGLPGLKTIASVGAGMDKFDLAWLGSRGIEVHPTPHVMSEDTAECAVALVFALLRNIVANDCFVRRRDWASSRAPLGWRISERKVGVVGLGRIGGKVAHKLSVLGCEVSYTARTEKAVPWRFVRTLPALAEMCDVLVLCCSGGEATRGLIDGSILSKLGPYGFLVNVSRGSVVDETALIETLEQGTIAGAALDVFENEPTPDLRFLDLQNCILQPHAAVYTHENRRDLIAEIRRILTVSLQEPARDA